MQVTIKAQKIVEICDKTISELKELEEQALKKSKELSDLFSERNLRYEKEMQEYHDYLAAKHLWIRSTLVFRGKPPVVKTEPKYLSLYHRHFKDTKFISTPLNVEYFKNRIKHVEDVVLEDNDIETLFRIEHEIVKDIKEYLQTSAQEDFDKVWSV